MEDEALSTVTFRFRATSADIVQSSFELVAQSPGARNWAWLWLLAMVGGAAIGIRHPSEPLAVTAALLPLPLWLVVRAYARARVRRIYRESPNYRYEYTYQFGPFGLRVLTDEPSDNFWSWAAFPRIEELMAGYVLHRSDGKGILLPRPALDHSSDARFRDLVRQYAPDRGVGLARERSPLPAS